MQSDLVSLGAAACPGATPALLANLTQLLQPTPADRARYDETLERSAQRQRRRQTDYQDAVALAAAEPRPAEIIAHSEREMRPGSAAARQEQLRNSVADRAAAQPEARSFRQVLADSGRHAPEESSGPAKPTAAGPGPAQGSDESPSGAMKAGVSAKGNADAASGPAQSANGAANLEVSGTEPTGLPRTGATAPPAVGGPMASVSSSPSASRTAATVPLPGAGAAPPAMLLAESVSPPPTAAVAPAVRSAAIAPAAPVATEMAPTSVARRAAQPASDGTTGSAEDAERTSDANLEQILRTAQTQIGKDRAVATLRLDPPELGTVRLHLDLRGEQLGLVIEAQTPAARRVLEGELDKLRHGLEAGGIQLERVELRTAAREPPAAGATPQHGLASDGQGRGRSGGEGQDAANGQSTGHEASYGTASWSGSPDHGGSAAQSQGGGAGRTMDGPTTVTGGHTPVAESNPGGRGPATESLVDVLA